MNMRINKKTSIRLTITGAITFAMIYVGVYSLSLLVPFLSIDVLGILRTFITAIASKLLYMTEDAEQTSIKLVGARAITFSVVNIGVYILLLLVPIPFADNVGILRAFITAVPSTLLEQVIFKIVRQLIESEGK